MHPDLLPLRSLLPGRIPPRILSLYLLYEQRQSAGASGYQFPRMDLSSRTVRTALYLCLFYIGIQQLIESEPARGLFVGLKQLGEGLHLGVEIIGK